MSKKLEFWGILGTVIYLIVIATTVAFKFESFINLELNALGDFLAGAFGPIAFLWLVLGFLQQGRELKLSTDALQLQAQELKNSVEQQSIMAAAALQQIDAQKAALILQEQEITRSISPILNSVTGSRQGGPVGSDVRTSIQIQNLGEEAREVVIEFDPPLGGVELTHLGKLQKGVLSRSIDFVFPMTGEDRSGRCAITYLRADGKRITEEFTYAVPASNPFVYVEKLIRQRE